MTSIRDTAERFFEACETGQGWAGCEQYCEAGATFAAAETMMTAQRFAVPYSIVRVMRSPTTEPIVAARKLKSMTATATL